MARQLYARGLRPEHRAVVDEAQSKEQIDYRQEDQVQGVKEIVNLIAVDPPIAIVTRLISSFNKVTSCVRRNNEYLNIFVDRFRGVASQDLMHAGASTSSRIGEVLAITMLNNAKLEEGTLTNAKMQLVALAESRLIDEKNETKGASSSSSFLKIPFQVFDDLKQLKTENDVISSLR